eukprot:scaffold20659_cov64-Phaeocystis_antarctica.AAC.4
MPSTRAASANMPSERRGPAGEHLLVRFARPCAAQAALKLHACASSRLAACCFTPRGPEPGSVVKRCQVSSTGALTSSLSSYIELHV